MAMFVFKEFFKYIYNFKSKDQRNIYKISMYGILEFHGLRGNNDSLMNQHKTVVCVNNSILDI